MVSVLSLFFFFIPLSGHGLTSDIELLEHSKFNQYSKLKTININTGHEEEVLSKDVDSMRYVLSFDEKKITVSGESLKLEVYDFPSRKLTLLKEAEGDIHELKKSYNPMTFLPNGDLLFQKDYFDGTAKERGRDTVQTIDEDWGYEVYQYNFRKKSESLRVRVDWEWFWGSRGEISSDNTKQILLPIELGEYGGEQPANQNKDIRYRQGPKFKTLQLPSDQNPQTCVRSSFSPKGTYFVIECENHINLFRSQTGKLIDTFSIEYSFIPSISWVNDMKFAAMLNEGPGPTRSFGVYTIKNNKLSEKIYRFLEDRKVWDLTTRGSNVLFVLFGSDSRSRLYKLDPATGKQTFIYSGEAGESLKFIQKSVEKSS